MSEQTFKSLRSAKLVKTPTKEIAENILKLIACGLPKGLGKPRPGKMCVEALVCYATGDDHDDRPQCVKENVSTFKIQINDLDWSSPIARANGLRELAIAQLGSNGCTQDFDRAVNAVIYDSLERAIKSGIPSFKFLISEAFRDLTELAQDQNSFEDFLENLSYVAKKERPALRKEIAKLFGFTGKDAFPRWGASVGMKALRRIKSPGLKYLYLIKK